MSSKNNCEGDCIKRLCRKVENNQERIGQLEQSPTNTSQVIRNEDGDYVHSNGAGASTTILTGPSENACNGIRRGSDLLLFAEDMGYVSVHTFQDLVDAIGNNGNVLVCSELSVDQNVTLEGTGSLYFTPSGMLNLNGFKVSFDIPVINPSNGQIFRNFALDETYPARTSSSGTSVVGSFGGNNERDPRWWGLTAKPSYNLATEAEAIANSDAISAAALSPRLQNTGGALITVKLPSGYINVKRPIRLDSIKCRLEGQGYNATQVWAYNDNYTFDTSHFILTTDYPTDGSTPVIQIGSELGHGGTIEEGFGGGVSQLAVFCPDAAGQAARRVSGIMWEAQLQEQTVLEYVYVQNYGGYGIGGPRFQHLTHNPTSGGVYDPESDYPQVNSVHFNNLWIVTPARAEAIAMNVFGRNFDIDMVTVDHGKAAAFQMTNHPIQTGSSYVGKWSNIHIESNPGITPACGINCLTAGGVIERLSFSEINLLNSQVSSEGGPRTYYTLWLQNDRGGYSCENISCRYPYNHNGRAIRDERTGKDSTGYHGTQNNGTHVASYHRQMTAGVYQVSTSDPALA